MRASSPVSSFHGTLRAVIALTSHFGVQRWAPRYHPGANIKIRFLFLERLKKYCSHLGARIFGFWRGFGEGAGFINPVTEPKRPVRHSLGEGGSQKPKGPLSQFSSPNGCSIILTALGLLVFGCTTAHAAIALTESVFTEIINDAKVVTASTQAAAPAKPNEIFKAPDLVRTGPASRVELTAADHTITRIGANTIFTFEPTGRSIYLEKGSVLFHSPPGMGGGAIKHGGASAAVLGTTIIGAILFDGSFKIMVLEGQCLVTLRNESTLTLNAGQMVIIPADGNSFGQGVMTFNIQQLVARLLLVQGFSNPLPSLPQINDAIQQQNADIANGTAGPFVSFDVASQGLDLTGGKPPSNFPPVSPIIDHTGLPISPTTGKAP